MKLPTETQLEQRHRRCPIGARVEVIHMDDSQSPPVGTCGTVLGIDGLGDILVQWDNGSTLKLIPEIDQYRILPICPICGKAYSDRSALSRTDNQTEICPDCGTRQALDSVGMDQDAQEEILDAIHASAL